MEQCRLCLRDVANLEDSHYISAGIYRILRDETEKNPNPWLVTKKTAVQTSRQMTAPLLCSECEQRFSKHGETWVLGHCLRKDGSFPLASILAARIPDVWSNETATRIYHASGISEINISALAYFAASIFWRGSIHPWNDDGSIPVQSGAISGAVPTVPYEPPAFSEGLLSIGCDTRGKRDRPPDLLTRRRAKGQSPYLQISHAGPRAFFGSKQKHPC